MTVLDPNNGDSRRSFIKKIAAVTSREYSESEVGEIAVARRDARGGCEQAVDRGHQAAENSRGRSEGGGSGLGHLGPLFWSAAARRAAF